MKLRVLLGTVALTLAVAAVVPSAAEAGHRYVRYRHRPVVRVFDTYRPYRPYFRPFGFAYAYDPYYYDDYYYAPPPRVYAPVPVYRPYYYRPYRPFVGVRVGGPRFGVFFRW